MIYLFAANLAVSLYVTEIFLASISYFHYCFFSYHV
jgi:hypothetical protein